MDVFVQKKNFSLENFLLPSATGNLRRRIQNAIGNA
jgi:hypothetical protein